MSKKYLLLVFIIPVFLGLLFRYFSFQPNTEKEEVLSTTKKQDLKKEIIIDGGKILKIVFNNHEYIILAVQIRTTDNLLLIPNFKEEYYAEDIAKTNECDYAINGGFYREDGLPLGLFYSNNTQLGKTAKSSIAKGFFIQKKDGDKNFALDPPKDYSTIDFAFQSGPLFQARNIRLPMIKDEFARRSLIGWDESSYYLITVFSSENFYEGPLLSDLPSIFADKNIQNTIPFKLLLNLDGGSASFFYSKNSGEPFVLSSFSNVGSVICMKRI